MNLEARKGLIRNVMIGAVIGVLAALGFVQWSRHSGTNPKGIEVDRPHYAEIRAHAAAIESLKASCGIETKIEDEKACQCRVEIALNRHVDEIEALVLVEPSLETFEIELDGGVRTSVQRLLAERLPEPTDCP